MTAIAFKKKKCTVDCPVCGGFRCAKIGAAEKHSAKVHSLEHYEKILGFDRAWQWSEVKAFEEPERPSFACVTRGEYSLYLCEKGQGNPGAWICLSVRTRNELETLFEEYKANGATVIEEPQDRLWGRREMVVQDLDGNTFRMGTPIGGEDNVTEGSETV